MSKKPELLTSTGRDTESTTTSALKRVLLSIKSITDVSEVNLSSIDGLSDFYVEMTDPTIRSLELVLSDLSSFTHDQLQILQEISFEAESDPGKVFVAAGAPQEDIERLNTGIRNVNDFISYLMTKDIYKSGPSLLSNQDFRQTLAVHAHERIQVNKGLMQISKFTEAIKIEDDINHRYLMGVTLSEKLIDFIRSHSYSIYKSQVKIEDPTWEDIENLQDFYVEKRFSDGILDVGNAELSEAIVICQAVLARFEYEQKLQTLPVKDSEYFNTLRLQYGAKAANLIILSKSVDQINQLHPSFHDVKLVVPDFKAVEVDLYEIWKSGKSIDDQLHSYYDWVCSLSDNPSENSKTPENFIVRSSAVFSEDDEHVTGAGIYESVKLFKGFTFEQFKEAVQRVYRSVNSEQAKSYRALNGIEEEQMGLIIQKYVEQTNHLNSSSYKTGYANSRLVGVPQLLEIRTKYNRNYVVRDALDFNLGLDTSKISNIKGVNHFKPDTRKITSEQIARVAKITRVLEHIYGTNIQIEFVISGHTVHVVQVRNLPNSSEFFGEKIEFPSEPPIFSGDSIGIVDITLPVLDNEDDNSEKEGVVVFESNNMRSLLNPNRLPKKNGAVIILDDNAINGHLQTLCAEKGLVCIFPNRSGQGTEIPYSKIIRLAQLRIVSNGLEGRVYAVSDAN